MEEGQKAKILIIEDDRFIAKMYETKLNLEGFEVEVAENGKIGLDKIGEFHPNLILLDIIMPEMDGFEVLESLKNDESFNKAPILIMSNLGQEDHLKKAKALGIKDYIVKSQYTPMDVVEKIRGALGATAKN